MPIDWADTKTPEVGKAAHGKSAGARSDDLASGEHEEPAKENVQMEDRYFALVDALYAADGRLVVLSKVAAAAADENPMTFEDDRERVMFFQGMAHDLRALRKTVSDAALELDGLRPTSKSPAA